MECKTFLMHMQAVAAGDECQTAIWNFLILALSDPWKAERSAIKSCSDVRIERTKPVLAGVVCVEIDWVTTNVRNKAQIIQQSSERGSPHDDEFYPLPG